MNNIFAVVVIAIVIALFYLAEKHFAWCIGVFLVLILIAILLPDKDKITKIMNKKKEAKELANEQKNDEFRNKRHLYYKDLDFFIATWDNSRIYTGSWDNKSKLWGYYKNGKVYLNNKIIGRYVNGKLYTGRFILEGNAIARYGNKKITNLSNETIAKYEGDDEGAAASAICAIHDKVLRLKYNFIKFTE